jgi:hypothetical protein
MTRTTPALSPVRTDATPYSLATLGRRGYATANLFGTYFGEVGLGVDLADDMAIALDGTVPAADLAAAQVASTKRPADRRAAICRAQKAVSL